MHARLARVAVFRDPHFGDGHAAAVTFSGQEPEGGAVHRLRFRADDDVVVAFWFHELIECGAESFGYGDELFEGDALVPGLDAAQRRRGQVAASSEGVEGPASGEPEPADPLSNDRLHHFLRHTQESMLHTGLPGNLIDMTNPHHHKNAPHVGGSHHQDPWRDVPEAFVEILERESRLSAPVREAALAAVAMALHDELRQIVDLGSGVGADAVMLAERFPTAEVHALDLSSVLLERVRAAAEAAGVQDRVGVHCIDLDDDWPPAIPQGVDLFWASLALHHVDDPARALRQVFTALRPGGVLVLTELRGEVRLAPADLGTGMEGLADRIAPALSAPAQYLSIDWLSLLAEAGFTSASHSEHDVTVDASTPDGAAFLQLRLGALRERAADDLPEEDIAAVEAVAEALPVAGSSISLASTRSLWVAVRAASGPDTAAVPCESLEADVAVVGGGSAGLAAAIALARSRRTVVVVDAGRPRNAPAEGAHNVLGQEGIPPRELLAKGRAEAESYGARIVPGHATAITGSIDGFTVDVDSGAHRVQARRIILASGLEDDLPGIPGVAEGWGRSVLHCPFCHGWEVRDQRVAILARDAVALHQAVLFRQLSDRVTVFLHDAHDPTVDEQEQLAALDVAVVRPRVEHLVMDGSQVRGVATADGRVFDVDAVVVVPRFNARTALYESLGGVAEDFPFGKQIPADPRGMTSVPGVWAAGNANNPMAMVVAAAAAGVATGAAVHGDLCMADLDRAVQERRAHTDPAR